MQNIKDKIKNWKATEKTFHLPKNWQDVQTSHQE